MLFRKINRIAISFRDIKEIQLKGLNDLLTTALIRKLINVRSDVSKRRCQMYLLPWHSLK